MAVLVLGTTEQLLRTTSMLLVGRPKLIARNMASQSQRMLDHNQQQATVDHDLDNLDHFDVEKTSVLPQL